MPIAEKQTAMSHIFNRGANLFFRNISLKINQ